MPAGFKNFIERLKSKKYLNIIIGLIIIFAGLDLFIVGQKELWVNYLGIFLFILGVAYLLFVFLPYLKMEYKEKKESLASRFLSFITLKGKLQPFFPVLGLAIVIIDLVYNVIHSGTPALLTFDTIALLFGGWLIFHNFIPKRFERERDFIFMFLFFLVIILVIPLLTLRIAVGNYEQSVNFFSATLLVPPVTGFLTLFGVPILPPDITCPNVDGTQIYMMLKSGDPVCIGITTECSGIFSFVIFASAFMAFVLIEFARINKKVVALLGLGVFTAYLANILRMTIIMLVGYHYDAGAGDLKNMLFAHANVGWIIFLLWISLFWALMYKFLMKEKEPEAKAMVTEPKKKGVLCSICSEIMKVDVPGYRCQCGRFYHLGCIEDLKECPNCKRALNLEEKS